jgi:hypothetical protein
MKRFVFILLCVFSTVSVFAQSRDTDMLLQIRRMRGIVQAACGGIVAPAVRSNESLIASIDELDLPIWTEGDTDTDIDIDTETETDPLRFLAGLGLDVRRVLFLFCSVDAVNIYAKRDVFVTLAAEIEANNDVARMPAAEALYYEITGDIGDFMHKHRVLHMAFAYFRMRWQAIFPVGDE